MTRCKGRAKVSKGRQRPFFQFYAKFGSGIRPHGICCSHYIPSATVILAKRPQIKRPCNALYAVAYAKYALSGQLPLGIGLAHATDSTVQSMSRAMSQPVENKRGATTLARQVCSCRPIVDHAIPSPPLPPRLPHCCCPIRNLRSVTMALLASFARITRRRMNKHGPCARSTASRSTASHIGQTSWVSLEPFSTNTTNQPSLSSTSAPASKERCFCSEA